MPDDGLHDSPGITLNMMLTDPKSVRWEERVKAGKATINGVSIADRNKVTRMGPRHRRGTRDANGGTDQESDREQYERASQFPVASFQFKRPLIDPLLIVSVSLNCQLETGN